MNQSTNYFGQHLFSQITTLCNKATLQPVIKKTNANRYYKRLHFYEHFISMLYCVLSGCTSLREIVSGLSIAEGKLNHLGIDYVPPRSTLSDGNKQRSSNIFKAAYEHLYKLYKPSLSDSTLPKGVLSKLFLLDATVFWVIQGHTQNIWKVCPQWQKERRNQEKYGNRSRISDAIVHTI